MLGQLLEMMGRRPGIIKQTATRLKLIEFYERVIHVKPFDMVKQSKWRHNVQPLERLSFDCFMGILNYPLVNDRYSNIEDLVNVIQYTGVSSYVLEPINMDKHNKMRIMYLERGISTYGQLLKAADSDCDRLWKLIDQCDHDYFTPNRQNSLTARILGIFSDEFKKYVWTHVYHNDSNLKVL